MGKKIKILYVDDENINIKLFEISFSRTYTVLTANNPIKGLEILSNHDDIDIVFSDMDMPFFNGVQFIQEAKKIHPNIKYYILSGFEKNAEMQKALDENIMLNFFKKPINHNEIELVIEKSVAVLD